MDVIMDLMFVEVMFLKILMYVIISFFGLEIEGIWIFRFFGIWLDIIWIVVVVVNDLINGVDIYVVINLSFSNFKFRSRIFIISEDLVVIVVFILMKFFLFICFILVLELLLFLSNMDGDNWFCIIFVLNNEMIVLVLKEING